MASKSDIETLKQRVKAGPLPRHVGVIMDGNGRWAQARGQGRVTGHREGSESVRAVTRTARQVGLQALTLYAFSSQNWSRPGEEVAALMELLREYLVKERDEIMENGIRLNAIGDLDRLPPMVREPLEALRKESAGNKGMVLTLALSYGGQEELVRAAKRLIEAAQGGRVSAESLRAADMEAALDTAGLPPVDMVIRTSGELRLSNFMLYQVAYAELYFTDTAWPDFREKALLEALLSYRSRERRFGMTGEQVRKKKGGSR